MKSRDIKDYTDIGLNADWCVSTYLMEDNYYIFDNEDDTFSLMKVENTGSHEEDYTEFFTGTFGECIDYFNEMNHCVKCNELFNPSDSDAKNTGEYCSFVCEQNHFRR